MDDSALMEEEVSALREEIEKGKTEKLELEAKLEEMEKHVNELEKVKKKLESEEFEHQEKLIEMESEKEEQMKLVEELQEKLKQGAKGTSEKIKNSEKQLANQMEEMSALNKQMKAEVKELERKMDEMKTESGIQLKEAQDKLSVLKEDLENSTQSKCKLEEELKETADLLAETVEKEKKLKVDLEIERKSKASAIAQQEVKLQRTTSSSNVKLVEVEVRADSLEKELATKDHYVKELEDIIVEKETRIIELEGEGSKDKDKELEASLESKKRVEEELKNMSAKLEEGKKDKEGVETELSNMEAELLKVDADRQKLSSQLEEVQGKLAHQEEVKRQREDLERRTNELMVTSSRLEALEQELQASKDQLKSLEERLGAETGKTRLVEEKLAAEVGKTAKLKSELTEAKDEVKMNKVATKRNAKEALEVGGVKERAAELEKEVTRLKSLAEAHGREGAALEVLRSELNSKTGEIAALMKKNELLASESSANAYELEKTKQERTRLMAHYETKFKGLQSDLDKERSRKTEVGKLQEAMARATPTKATNELKERLRREEEKVLELREELVALQKQSDERSALHEREMKRAKQASDRTAEMYREQNVVLQRQWRDDGARTGASSNEVLSQLFQKL